jgi:transketolase
MSSNPSLLSQLPALARLVRYHSLSMTSAAESGHLTSSLSAADLMTGLLFGGTFRFDPSEPNHPNNDRLIFSKGHASPLFYALWAVAGCIEEKELRAFRTFGSRLEGHPTPRFPYAEAATGSLGQGLSIGLGMALNAARLDQLPYRTYVLLGDSEMAEGSQWEAIQLAAHYQLSNLVGIIDVNRLGQRGETMLGDDIEAYADRVRAFGWKTLCIDGHDFSQIVEAFREAQEEPSVPVMIIARTVKGKGISFLEDAEDWHGKALSGEKEQAALQEFSNVDRTVRGRIASPEDRRPQAVAAETAPTVRYELGEKVATRKAYGNALKRIAAKFPQLVSLDGEVSNSTMAEIFDEAAPQRFFEMYIAEQNMVGAALGLSLRGRKPFVSTFAAFLTRAFDQIRMCQYSNANITFVGSHAGVSIGEDGPSQMGLEDIAMFRSLLSSVVLHPCDAVSTEKLVEAAAVHPGIVYLRTLRQGTPVIYPNDMHFKIGGSRVLRQSPDDQVTLVSAGATVHEALEAHEQLRKRGIYSRVIDAYSIKPIDVDTLRDAANATGRLVTVEDHYPAGGLGEAVLAALSESPVPVTILAVNQIPTSGKGDELRQANGISAESIAATVERLLAKGERAPAPEPALIPPAQDPIENPLRLLATYGQSIWLDYIKRSFLKNGELRTLIAEDGLSGVTSNPAIFEEAIIQGHDYDEDLQRAREHQKTADETYANLVITDVKLAADDLREVFDRTLGHDGFVSLEVSPHLAHDSEGSIAQARELWQRVARPNVMIKIPGTEAALPAIRHLIAEGININVTLIFGLTRYRAVVEAYLSGIEDRFAAGQPIDEVASVASFFLSRIDVAVDRHLEKLGPRHPEFTARAEGLRGQAAIASAKQAYQMFKDIFGGERFRRLAAAGARPQRLLWASTGTKNPEERDVRYVEALIGPETVTTLPRVTLEAFRDHGEASPQLETGLERARGVLRELGELGISLEAVSRELESEGLRKFVEPFNHLYTELERRLESGVTRR